MHTPDNFTRIVDRKRYSTKTANLIAHDAWWDGHNFERHGRNTFLYRTQNGAYFTITLSQWQGEQDSLEPISKEEALSLYENELREHKVEYQDAFPDVKVEDA